MIPLKASPLLAVCGALGLWIATTPLSLLADPMPGGPGVVLGVPTDHSLTLSVRTPTEFDAYVEYDAGTPDTAGRSRTLALRADEPVEFALEGLHPDTRYAYRVCVRTKAEAAFRPACSGFAQTARRPGAAFMFALQGDSHPEREGRMFDRTLYAQNLRRVAAEPPDFYLLLGDDFSIERLIGDQTLSQPAVDQVYARQRSFLETVGASAALFLVNGNHEQAARANLDGTANNPAVLAARARTRFFPLPAPDTFYSGDREEVPLVGLARDYYAWTWGDALFVVIDPYWHSPEFVDNRPGERAKGGKDGKGDKGGNRTEKGAGKGAGKGRDLWQVTLGEAQYRWLERTLSESRARWKFVFCHHVSGTGRGGIECAPFYEWGGRDRNGAVTFAQHRPGWALPLHDLFVKAGVTIVFQGHDHLYARQELDGIVYQTCPNPADPTYSTFNRDAYRSGTILPNSGHLRVAVSPETVRVDYIRSFLETTRPADHRDGEIADSYSISSRPASSPPTH